MVKDQVLRAAAYFLRPIARLLLRSEISWPEFSELSKQAFVDVARQDYGLQGRPTNAARVAMITGLSRREVTRVRDVLLDKRASPTPPASPISRILTGWHVDDQFVDTDSETLQLERFGEGATLETLLRRYAGAMPHGAIVKELLQLGLVIEAEPDQFRVVSRHYTRHDVDPDLVWQMGRALHDHASTLAHNVNDKRE